MYKRYCYCPIGESWKNDAIPKTLYIKRLIKYVHEIGKFEVHWKEKLMKESFIF